MTTCKISPFAFGLSLGVVWGAAVLVVGLLSHFFEYGTAFVTAMGVMYIGYEPSILGGFIGGLMGFIDAFVVGALIACLYNVFSSYCSKKRILRD